ncbi:autotransporter outer membrane beta-barrel domain-containing protein, partial [Bartonella sp. LJL80]
MKNLSRRRRARKLAFLVFPFMVSSVAHATDYDLISYVNTNGFLNEGDSVRRLVAKGTSATVTVSGAVTFNNKATSDFPSGLTSTESNWASASTVSLFGGASIDLGNGSFISASGQGAAGKPQRNLVGLFVSNANSTAANLNVDVTSNLGAGNKTYLYGIRTETASNSFFEGKTSITLAGDTTGWAWGALANTNSLIEFESIDVKSTVYGVMAVAAVGGGKIHYKDLSVNSSGGDLTGVHGNGGQIIGTNTNINLTGSSNAASLIGIYSNKVSDIRLDGVSNISLKSQWNQSILYGVFTEITSTAVAVNDIAVNVDLYNANGTQVAGVMNKAGVISVNGTFRMDGIGVNPTTDSAYIKAMGQTAKINLNGTVLIGKDALNENEKAFYALNGGTISANTQQQMFVIGNFASDGGTINIDAGKLSYFKGAGLIANNGVIDLTLRENSRWDITENSTVSHLTNMSSVVAFSYNSGFKTLTIDDTYAGDDGTFIFNTQLGDDSSPTDFLHVLGNSSGQSYVQVVNRGGLGALTTGDGIQLIKVDGTSSADNFALKSDYSFEGQAAVVGGAYAYSLYAGNKAGDFAGDWYLRSLYVKPVEPPQPPVGPVEPPVIEPKPVYSAVVPMYEVYPQILQQLNKLGTLEQRIGNRTWIGTGSDRQTATINEMEGRGFWMKVEGSTGHINSNV